MYQDHLHIPRRPFSPDEYAASSSFSPASGLGQHARQREPSDSSVEALDLVDYAGTLRRGGAINYDPYAAVPRAFSPPRPFSVQSHSNPPPSLYTGSSAPSSQPDYSTVGGSRRPILHSIPDPVHSFRHHNHHHHHHPHSHEPAVQPPYSHEQEREERMEFGALEDDLDLSKFPTWSRDWFKHHRLPELDLADPYADPYNDRDLLPWSSRRSGRSEYSPVSPGTREERLKQLQKEFGSSKNQPWAGPDGRLDSDNMIGSVDEKGRLITGGRKRRITARVGQAFMVLIAGGVSIYAALFIKVTNPATPPPPAGRFGTWALYVLSVITLLGITYVFALQPCCCPGNREGKDGGDSFTALNGMTVLPVQGGMNGKANQKKNKKWAKKHKGMPPPQQDIQVNLIVDPQMLRQQMNGGEQDEDDDRTAPDDDGEDWNRTIRPRRRSVFQGFRMEAQWKVARSRLMKHIAFDAVFMVLWGVEFVLILLGPRCPTGDFNGWCNAFNLATAASCFLVLLFGLSVYFGVRDYHASKISPRQRT